MRDRAKAAALLAGLVTVVLWGSAFVGIRAAGTAFDPGPLALGRVLVGCVALGALVLVQRDRRPLPARRDLAAIACYGVLFLGLYSITLNAAERRVDAGTAAMIINTGPILIALLAGLFLREGYPRGLFAGCAIAFGGVVLIALGSARTASGTSPGIVLCVVAAVSYAVAVVVQKAVLARVSALTMTWLGCLAGAVACLPFAPSLFHQVYRAEPAELVWLVYLGVGPTALGFVTWNFALRRTSAGRAGALNYLIPVVAIVLGWTLLDETPPWPVLVGGAVCLSGVYLARVWKTGQQTSVTSPASSAVSKGETT